MTQVEDTAATTELIARTLDSVRAACEDLSELAEYKNGIAAVVQTAKGTALIHDLRTQLNVLDKILPFKS